LLIVKVCSTLLVPTNTEPKSCVSGAIVEGGDALPLPDTLPAMLPLPVVLLTVPLAAPTAVGANFTSTVQLAAGESEAPHVVDRMPNGAAVENAESATGALAGLAIVKVPGVLDPPTCTEPKLIVGGVTVGAGCAVALPVTGMLIDPELAVALITPLAGPTATGLKRASSEQLALGLSEAPQVFATIAKGPLTAKAVSVIDAGDGLVIVKVWVALAPVTSTLPKE
jgi:hypothetical protein